MNAKIFRPRDGIIIELEGTPEEIRSVLNSTHPVQQTFEPSIICLHDFPSPMEFGTVPQQCRKCGMQAPTFPSYVVTCQSEGMQ